jgi:hypothetical protein
VVQLSNAYNIPVRKREGKKDYWQDVSTDADLKGRRGVACFRLFRTASSGKFLEQLQ